MWLFLFILKRNSILTYWQFFSIEVHSDPLGGSSNVVSPSGHQSHGVSVQDAHFKLGQIWPEGNTSVFLPVKRFDASIPCSAHVVIPSLWKNRKNRMDCKITSSPYKLQQLQKKADMVPSPSYLLEGFLWILTGGLHGELFAKDVAKFSTISIASTLR